MSARRGRPLSISVGQDLSTKLRSAVVTARTRTRPDLMCGMRGAQRRLARRDLAAGGGGDRRCAALVGDVQEFRAGVEVHPLQHQVVDRAGAGRGHADRPGLRLGGRDQLLHGLDRAGCR